MDTQVASNNISGENAQKIRELLAGEGLGVLGTTDHGHPNTNLVAFAEEPTLHQIVFFTRRNRPKYRNIKSDGRVSIYIDTRDRTLSNPEKVVGLSVTGVAWEIKKGEEYQELKALYLKKNPHMKDFVSDPEAALFKINVELYKYMVDFEVIFEVQI